MKNLAAAMQSPQLRFWAVEHATTMFGAVVLAHLGRVLARNATSPSVKRMRVLVCFGLTAFLMILGMPWPGLANGRPLFRF